MRLLALADTHLGFETFTRLAPTGENQRSADVMATFSRFVDKAIELRPDVITVAGDWFHNPRPKNRVVTFAFREWSRLIHALPDTIVVGCLGNHDRDPRDGSSILPLFAELPNVHIAIASAMRFRFPDRDLSVLAVPDIRGQDRPVLRPQGSERFHVLCLHGEAVGVKQGHGEYARAALTDITPDELGADAWSFVALGHWHQYEHLAENVAYSGSLDFCSTNAWQEIDTPKGFIERDLATGAETFHALEPARRFIDLEPLYAQGLRPDELDQRIAETLESQSIDGAVVRLKVLDVSRDIERALNQKALRAFARRALFLRLDFRRPAAIEAVSASGAPLGRRQFSPIEEKIRAFLGSDKREIAADVDRGALIDKALFYLKEAAAKDADSPEQETKLTEQLTDSLKGAA